MPHPKTRPQALRQALQEQTRAAYREAILDAAEKVFLSDGFQSAKMVDVAEATGVSVGTLYNYFESKEAVFSALVERHRSRYFQLLKAPFDAEDPVTQLKGFVLRTLKFVEDNGALYAIYLQSTGPVFEGAQRSAPSINAECDNEQYQSLLSDLLTRSVEAGSIRNDVPIHEMAWTLHSLLHAAVLEWVGASERKSLVEKGHSLVQLFLEGASAK